jgi:hypothetical protein
MADRLDDVRSPGIGLCAIDLEMPAIGDACDRMDSGGVCRWVGHGEPCPYGLGEEREERELLQFHQFLDAFFGKI